jgi:LmbE family N-acetylglucosaminyl deacetylase
VPRRPRVGPRPARKTWPPVTGHRAGAAGLTGRSVVVLHAHPDDESIFTAAAIRRLADRGARVVVVTATRGEEGTPLTPLRPGETLVSRRVRELESACALLGVARLDILGYRDSGMAGAPTNRHPRAFARRALSPARRLVDLLEGERAEALVHYDPAGIYGHPDHVAIARLGRWLLQRVPVTGYEATVDPEHLLTGPRHLVEGSRSRTATSQLGSRPSAITTTLCARAAELVTKRRAMALYDSQVPRNVITDIDFGRIYEREWFIRSGPHSILDEIADDPAGRLSGTGLSA